MSETERKREDRHRERKKTERERESESVCMCAGKPFSSFRNNLDLKFFYSKETKV
jgi:hypothetical protein